MQLKGIFCPITTPFVHGRLDEGAFVSNMLRLAETGLRGFVVLGSSGEAVLLSEQEKLSVVQKARDCLPNLPLVAGTGCESTRATIELTQKAADHGAQVALVVTPGYYKQSLDHQAFYHHYVKVAENTPIPIIIYNVPKFTGVDLDLTVIKELSGHPNICGIKDSTADMEKVSRVIGLSSPVFSVLVGNAANFYSGLAAGADGAILALCNVAAKACVDIYRLLLKNDIELARELFARVLPVAQIVVGRFGVPGIKAAMDMLGLIGGEPVGPLQRLKENQKKELILCLNQAELLA